MKRHSLLISVVIYLLMSTAYMSGSSSGSDDPVQKGCLIFLYDSQACQCVRERNEVFAEFIEKQIRKNIIDTSFIHYQHFDYSSESGTVDSLLANSYERFLPVLMLKSCDNVFFYESSFLLDTLRFQRGLADFMLVYNKESDRD